MIERISTHLLEESGANFSFKSINEIKLNSRIHTLQNFKNWLTNYMGKNLISLPAEFFELSTLMKTDKTGYSKAVEAIFKALIDALWPESQAKEIMDPGLNGVDLTQVRSLYPVQDILDHDKVSLKMYDTASQHLSPITYQHWKLVVDRKTHDDRISKVLPGVFTYDPYNPAEITPLDIEGYKATKFNLYKKPKWVDKKPSGQLPEIAKKFFSHLFPDPKVREFIYTWMYHMLTRRARTYLYLPAPQNTGKTTFAYICGALVGRDNFELGKSDFAETKFNSFVSKKRLIILDEYNCWSNEEKDTLKRVINDRIQVEAKGVDQKTVDNFCSFIICNNNAEGITLDPVDRRFSVPEMTTQKLFKSLTEKELGFLNEQIEDEDSQFIADIGHWILTKFQKHKYSKDHAWQDKRFEEVVFASAREGMKYIIDQILAKKSDRYNYVKLRSDYKTLIGRNAHFPPHFKVREYLDNFKYGGKRICDVVWDGVLLEIIPTKEYMPVKKEEEF